MNITTQQQTGKPTLDLQLRIGDAVLDFVEEMTEEDDRMYARIIEEWLKDVPEGAEDKEKNVRFMRGLALSGMLGPLRSTLVHRTLREIGEATCLSEEKQFFEEFGGSLLSATGLDRYADYLLEHGYPRMAARLWDLCKEMPDHPDRLDEKLERARDRIKSTKASTATPT